MALEPITRQEKIIAGQDLTPITRLEMFLKNFGGGGGGGSGSGQFIVVVYNANVSGTVLKADKTYNEISAAIESGATVVIHMKKNINSADYRVFHHVEASAGNYQFCNNTHAAGETVLTTRFINIGVENGEMYIDYYSYNLQTVT